MRRARIIPATTTNGCEVVVAGIILAHVDELFATFRVHEIARWIQKFECLSERGENAIDF